MFSNLEALASAEGGYDQKIWERFYRPDGTGYNCAQPGLMKLVQEDNQ